MDSSELIPPDDKATAAERETAMRATQMIKDGGVMVACAFIRSCLESEGEAHTLAIIQAAEEYVRAMQARPEHVFDPYVLTAAAIREAHELVWGERA